MSRDHPGDLRPERVPRIQGRRAATGRGAFVPLARPLELLERHRRAWRPDRRELHGIRFLHAAGGRIPAGQAADRIGRRLPARDVQRLERLVGEVQHDDRSGCSGDRWRRRRACSAICRHRRRPERRRRCSVRRLRRRELRRTAGTTARAPGRSAVAHGRGRTAKRGGTPSQSAATAAKPWYSARGRSAESGQGSRFIMQVRIVSPWPQPAAGSVCRVQPRAERLRRGFPAPSSSRHHRLGDHQRNMSLKPVQSRASR